MTGAAIAIDDASAADPILSVKQRVFAVNHKMPMHRQRLMYRPGPFGIKPLADSMTLGGAGVAQDGSAVIDVLLADLTAVEVKALGTKVRHRFEQHLMPFVSVVLAVISQSYSSLFKASAIHLWALHSPSYRVFMPFSCWKPQKAVDRAS